MSDATRAGEEFEALFGRAPTTVSSAPGRVNLIGEHTDYNDGFVLPTAIPQRATIAIAPRGDGVVRAASREMGDAPISYALGEERTHGAWIDYVAGVTAILRGEGLAFGGFDARVSSDVSLGSGLSSSAALTVALLRALRSSFALGIDDVALPRFARRAENELVGAPVGIMDPMACHLCDERSALLLDTRSLAFERVPFPDVAERVVVSSGVAHRHASGDYRARREECRRACELLGVPSLREVAPTDLPRVMELPEPLGRRARHVVLESERVLRAAAAMRDDDVILLGQLLDESHASMRDDFEVSTPEIERLVSIARIERDVLGARLTGGGFGGSIVALVARGAGARVAASIVARYASPSRAAARVLVPEGG